MGKKKLDDLSVDELEQLLKQKKSEERRQRYKQMVRAGRIVQVNREKQSLLARGGDHAQDDVHSIVTSAPNPIIETTALVTQFDDDRSNALLSWKGLLGRGFIVVEAVAVIVLIYLGFNLFSAIGTLEQESAEAQLIADAQRRATLPTIAPTPQLQINQIVLPGGHTPPNEQGESEFNWSEIPTNLRPLVLNQMFSPTFNLGPVTSETPLRIIIPKLNIDQTIVQGTDWESLKLGIGQIQNGVSAGDDGNLVFAAHNDIYGEIFRYLDQLEPGDTYQVLTATQSFEYVVRGSQIVEPDAVEVMGYQGGATSTLISCYPYQVNTQRIVILAEQINV